MNIGLKSDTGSGSGDGDDSDGNSGDTDEEKVLNPDQVAKGGPKLVIGDNGRPIITGN
jgi:hypothetical protein